MRKESSLELNQIFIQFAGKIGQKRFYVNV